MLRVEQRGFKGRAECLHVVANVRDLTSLYVTLWIQYAWKYHAFITYILRQNLTGFYPDKRIPVKRRDPAAGACLCSSPNRCRCKFENITEMFALHTCVFIHRSIFIRISKISSKCLCRSSAIVRVISLWGRRIEYDRLLTPHRIAYGYTFCEDCFHTLIMHSLACAGSWLPGVWYHHSHRRTCSPCQGHANWSS